MADIESPESKLELNVHWVKASWALLSRTEIDKVVEDAESGHVKAILRAVDVAEEVSADFAKRAKEVLGPDLDDTDSNGIQQLTEIQKAKILIYNDEHEDAIAILWKFLTACEDPKQKASTFALLGWININKGAKDKAETYYAAALQNDPDNIDTNLYIADANMFGDHEKEEEHFRRAAAQGSAYACHQLASFLEKRDKTDEAEKFYKKACDLDLGGTFHSESYINFLIKAGRFDEAEKFVMQAAAQGFPQVFREIGKCYEDDLLQNEEAEQFYKRGIEEGDRRAYINLGALLIRNDNEDEGRELIAKALKQGFIAETLTRVKELISKALIQGFIRTDHSECIEIKTAKILLKAVLEVDPDMIIRCLLGSNS